MAGSSSSLIKFGNGVGPVLIVVVFVAVLLGDCMNSIVDALDVAALTCPDV